MEQTREFRITLYWDTNKDTVERSFGSINELLDFLNEKTDGITAMHVQEWVDNNTAEDFTP